MQLVIENDGTIRCLYDEAIDLAQLGPLEITRGSYVEPDSTGLWIVDLSPVDGPLLQPFPSRSTALDVEAAWLTAHWLQV